MAERACCAEVLLQARTNTFASSRRIHARNFSRTIIQVAGPLFVRTRTLVLGKDGARGHRVESGSGLLAGGLGDGRLAGTRGSMQENIVS